MDRKKVVSPDSSKNGDAGFANSVQRKKKSQLKLVWIRYRKNKLAMVGLVIFAVLLIAIVSAPLYMDYSKAITQSIKDAYQAPNAENIFGTDQFGRSLLARVVYGGRISLFAALSTAVIAFFGGCTLGGMAGYFGGKVETVIMRFCDILMAIPGTLLAMSIVAALGPGLPKLLIALSITQIPRQARTVRACMLSLRNQEFIEAAKCYGTKNARMIIKHLLPNALGPLIVGEMMGLGGTILSIAAMGYLGIGIQSPTPEWGSIISENQASIRYYPYLGIVPGLAIMTAVLSLNFIGDGLRDALDPKMKQ